MSEVKVTVFENMFGGMWKFSSNVAYETVVEVAKEWAHLGDGLYQHVYVRGWGDNRFAICFLLRTPGKPNMRHYIFTTSDELRRRFGNDLVGWDISHPVTLIGNHHRNEA